MSNVANVALNSRSDLFKALENIVEHNPDEIIIFSDEGNLSARDFLEEVARKKKGILSLGIEEQNTPISIYLPHSLDLITCIWSVISSNACYVPISMNFPDGRIEYITELSGSKILICGSEDVQRLEKLVPSQCLVVTPEQLDAASLKAELPNSSLDSLTNYERKFYTIFTSGSTGKPKGVDIRDSNIYAQLNWLLNTGYINRNSKIILKTPIGFDAAQMELLAPAFGAKCVLGTKNTYRDVQDIVRLTKKYSVNTLQLVPTILQAISEQSLVSALGSLDFLFVGGEAFTTKLAGICYKELPTTRIINLYGPTETTINSFFHEVVTDDLNSSQRVLSIGKPVDSVVYRIVDPTSNEVAEGQEGELHIGGAQVGAGYINRSDLTDERFYTINFGKHVNVRFYRTGDVVQEDNKGQLEFRGRIDNQIKINGNRVELDEIRAALESHPWVKHAAVVVLKNHVTDISELGCCIELNPREAALMDPGKFGEQHVSKKNKAQVKAQLAARRLPKFSRSASPIKLEITDELEEIISTLSFERKTYRQFSAKPVTFHELRHVIRDTEYSIFTEAPILKKYSAYKILSVLSAVVAPRRDKQRLLPKYLYASPGALYGVHVIIEAVAQEGLEDGIYYLDQEARTLKFITHDLTPGRPRLLLHLWGDREAIKEVYQVNVDEVLSLEAGHLIGSILLEFRKLGLQIFPVDYPWANSYSGKIWGGMQVMYIASASLNSDWPIRKPIPHVGVLLHNINSGIDDASAGTYSIDDGNISKVSNKSLAINDVVAINQRTFKQSSFGLSFYYYSNDCVSDYLFLGMYLQIAETVALQYSIGFMSSGYSSEEEKDLPSAKFVKKLISPCVRSYFALGGVVENSQITHRGMQEDLVQNKGPTEILAEDIATDLPSYMVPRQIEIVENIPLLPNGKIDANNVRSYLEGNIKNKTVPYIGPKNETETFVRDIFEEVLSCESISIKANFFDIGGDSLSAVQLVYLLEQKFSKKMDTQIIFEKPTIELLSAYLDNSLRESQSRLVKLAGSTADNAVICWPGLGGFPSNMREFAEKLSDEASVYGIQALGFNDGETALSCLDEIVQSDADEIQSIIPRSTRITLVGYSFGTNISGSIEPLLTNLGYKVSKVISIMPGTPSLQIKTEKRPKDDLSFSLEEIVLILSVFSRNIDIIAAKYIMEQDNINDALIKVLKSRHPDLEIDQIQRIIHTALAQLRSRPDINAKPESVLNSDIYSVVSISDTPTWATFLNTTKNKEHLEFDINHYDALSNPDLNIIFNSLVNVGAFDWTDINPISASA